jgi:hypothetical protein
VYGGANVDSLALQVELPLEGGAREDIGKFVKSSRRGDETLLQSRATVKTPVLAMLAQTPFNPSVYVSGPSGYVPCPSG